MRLRDIAVVAAFGLVGVLGVAACGADQGSSDGSGAQAAAPEAASGLGSGPAGAKPGAGADARPVEQPVSAQERHVVRTARMALRVDDVSNSATRAREVAERFGGFVANERTERDNAELSLRVASDRLDDALAALDELGDVTRREQQAEDVTEQVVDIQARIANQRASVERVRALMERASTVGEVVQVESELTTRQAALESLENRAAALAGQTELATVTVSLAGHGTAAPGEERGGFLGGLAAGWGALLATTGVLLTALGAVLPFAVALGVPVLAALLMLRRRRVAAQASPPASG